jgi:hypothetical protein
MTGRAHLTASLPKAAQTVFCTGVTIVAVQAPLDATSGAIGIVGSNSIGDNATKPTGHEVDGGADADHPSYTSL